ncbi:MAG: inositol monophosphatase family protein [Planctomycetota bacterium JB042]
MNADTFTNVALEAGRLAAGICRRVQQEQVVETQEKAGREPVTVADYASQAVILRALSLHCGDHAILAEENSENLRAGDDAHVADRVRDLVADALGEPVTMEQLCAWIDHQGDPASPYMWAIDPIDGTKGFLRKAQYAVAIGLLRERVPVAGALVCPNLAVDPNDEGGARGVVFHAYEQAGAFQFPLDGGDTAPIRANATTDAADVRVLGSVESSHGDPKLLTALVEELGFGGGIVRVDSQVKYGVLARGDAEVYLRPRSKPDWRDNAWDHVAGVAVAKEAGGRSTDVVGRPLDFSFGAKMEENVGVLTTHGPLHDEIVACLKRLVEG